MPKAKAQIESLRQSSSHSHDFVGCLVEGGSKIMGGAAVDWTIATGILKLAGAEVDLVNTTIMMVLVFGIGLLALMAYRSRKEETRAKLH